MQTSDFDYHLPTELIAQTPAEPRDSSRLLVLHRGEQGGIEHRGFRDLTDYLRLGDLMVFNRSRVIPARLHGTETRSGATVEVLLVRRLEPGIWQALGRPGRRLRAGSEVVITPRSPDAGRSGWRPHRDTGNPRERPAHRPPFQRGRTGQASASYRCRPILRKRRTTPSATRRCTPTPPAASPRPPPASTSPTGCWHQSATWVCTPHGSPFTSASIPSAPSTAKTSANTKSTPSGSILPQDTADAINRARRDGNRIIAVGTTTVRTLEHVARNSDGDIAATFGDADLFITPGHQFRLVDAMLTNFHLPRSTLLMLVSAFAGRERILAAYQEAIRREYRFYSFGDAMLIL